jgi:hypothetical protein
MVPSARLATASASLRPVAGGAGSRTRRRPCGTPCRPGAASPQAFADADQQHVTGIVAEGVVDQLEIVQVDEQQRDAMATGLRGNQGIRAGAAETGCDSADGSPGHTRPCASDRLRYRTLRRRLEKAVQVTVREISVAARPMPANQDKRLNIVHAGAHHQRALLRCRYPPPVATRLQPASRARACSAAAVTLCGVLRNCSRCGLRSP